MCFPLVGNWVSEALLDSVGFIHVTSDRQDGTGDRTPLTMTCLLSEGEPVVFATNSLQRRKKGLGLTGLRTSVSGSAHSKSRPGLMIGLPQNFRQISSIIDVDILPETHRRVRLHKHGTHKPLGFYIRDGVSVRVTQQGVEKVGSLVGLWA